MLLRLFCVYLFMLAVTDGFGPRKLYSMDVPTTVTSVKVIGKQIFVVGPWYIGVVDNVQWKFMQKARMKPRIINKDIADPRSIGRIPTGTFKGDKRPFFWVASYGVNETSGAIYILQETSDYSQWADISVDAGWNYEHSQWVDMDRDGLRDCLTARFRGGIGQMLWFKQPPDQGLWNQRIIHEGMADGNFLGFVHDRKTYILIAGNQFNSLGLYWTMNRKNDWKYSRQVRFRVIDNYGKYYDVQHVDLNKDGRMDVLTTTVQISSSRGHVLGYEIPDDLQNKIWRRRVLAAGFTGDYAPGKAIAYWPNKYKRKTDRPTIFLSGAGEEKIYILSPKPKTSGWGYIKVALQPGYGMIGIPQIIDLNGDSYPEIFVPQGGQVHVFSYDYSTSAAAAPTPKPTRRTTPERRLTVYRPPFYRPTSPALPTAPLPGASPLGNGFSSSNGGSMLPTYPDSPGSSGGVPQYPPGAVPRPGLSSGFNSAVNPLGVGQNFGPLQNPARNAFSPGVSGQNQQYLGAPQSGFPPSFQQQQPSGLSPNSGYSQNNPLQSGPRNPQQFRPQSGSNSFNQPPSQQQFYPQQQGQQPHQRPSQQFYPMNPNGNHHPNGVPNYHPHNPQNHQQPYYVNQQQGASSHNLSATSSTLTDTGSNSTDTVNLESLIPENLVLRVTSKNFSSHMDASAACEEEKQVLCNLDRLQDAVDFGGKVPEFKWGWFSMKDRAAKLANCEPGEVKHEGHVCHNGIYHIPILQAASLPALCCSVVNWATMTKHRYSEAIRADDECKNVSRHLCTIQEMLRVWDESSYKGYEWGWFWAQKQHIRMTHYCDPNNQRWKGSHCWKSKLEVSEVQDVQQVKGFCCPSSASVHKTSILTVLLCTVVMLFFYSNSLFV